MKAGTWDGEMPAKVFDRAARTWHVRGSLRRSNERDGKIPGGKPLGHDSGADHGGREQQ
jgi:hypothetical protein